MESVLGILAEGTVTQNLSVFDPASPGADSIRTLCWLVFAVAGAIFVLVEGVLFYSLWRFREPPPRPKNRSPQIESEPPQFYGGQPLEVAWTVAPALIVFVLVLVIARTLWDVKRSVAAPAPNDRALHVTVIGRQWWWEFRYEAYDGRELEFTTANELHIPVSADGTQRPVYLRLESADVIHSFWVPRLAGKTDLIPGHVNSMWLQTDQPDVYVGQCAEYCGTQHAGMLLRVVAEPIADFQAWLENQSRAARDDAAASAGRAVFLSQSCVNCHRIRGTPAAGDYAPDLTHLMSRQTIAAGLLPNTPQRLRDWIDDPQQEKLGCLMPKFALSNRQRAELVQYLLTLE